MILNSYVVSYFLITLLSLAVLLPASAVALAAAAGWSRARGTEHQGLVENRVYLVISLLWLGFLVRLAMIPLWFLTLQSLVPSVPGAMCMAGLHLLDLPASYLGTILKLLVPLAYLYWLVLDGADRRSPAQPFMRAKLLLLLPLALLALAESGLDVHFLGQVKPQVVKCCTSVFDVPRAGVLKWVRQSADLFLPLFLGGLGTSLASSLVLRRTTGGPARAAAALSAGFTLVCLVLTLHTRVAPRMLEAPFHQCAFCLWQEFPDLAVASALALTGLWLTVVRALLPRLEEHPAAEGFANRLSDLGLVLYALGTLEILARFALAG